MISDFGFESSGLISHLQFEVRMRHSAGAIACLAVYR